VYYRRLREAHLRYIRRREYGGRRVEHPLGLLEDGFIRNNSNQ
jgi:hypothetical protein